MFCGSNLRTPHASRKRAHHSLTPITQTMANLSFSSLSLAQEQIANLESLGYLTMTPIQAQTVPLILKGNDIIAKAKTGSGKTAAFGIGLLEKINPRFFGAQALVLCPTRELADQVGKALRKLARSVPNIKIVLLTGGKPFGSQKASLEHGGHVIVGTPGRVQDHLRKSTLELSGLKTLVLDEADRMLDMGFVDDILEIVAQTPSSRQTLLFSATYPISIEKISQSVQTDPVNISVEEVHEPDVIEQWFYEVNKQHRNEVLLDLLSHHQPATTVIFCHTKKQCDGVAHYLRDHRVQALAIHGDLEQRERDQVLVQFSNGSCAVLVATDVAARGLDIKSLQAVINYELPHDPEIYVHRIGRTGRAGETGIALSLFSGDERARVDAIEAEQNQPLSIASTDTLNHRSDFSLTAAMVTIQLDSGRKNKIRPGDILGALTRDGGFPGKSIGKIDIFDRSSYVAIERNQHRDVLRYLAKGKVKGRAVRARKLS